MEDIQPRRSQRRSKRSINLKYAESSSSSAGEDQDDHLPAAKGLKKRPLLKKAKTFTGPKLAFTKTLLKSNLNKNTSKPPTSTTGLSPLQSQDASSVLYDEILAGRVKEASQDWFSRLENEQAAVLDLVNLVIKSSGSVQLLSSDSFDHASQNEHEELMAILNAFQAESLKSYNRTDYPLISKDKTWKHFRKHCSEFVQSIVAYVSTDTLWNTEIIPELINWWIAMSSLQYRPFRFTATFFSLKFSGALRTVICEFNQSISSQTRQLQMESRKKKSQNADTTVLLNQSINNLTNKVKQCEEWQDAIFTGVVVQRFRDVDLGIRIEVIAELTDWIIEQPSKYFNDQSLRYIGWSLSEKSSHMRSLAAKSVTRLLALNEPNFTGALRGFVERFRTRLLQMAMQETDLNARVAAIEAIALILQAGMFETEIEEREQLGALVFVEQPRIRKAAASIIKSIVDTDWREDEEDSSDISEQNTARLQRLKALIAFLKDRQAKLPDFSQVPSTEDFDEIPESLMTMASESLYAEFEILKDWKWLSNYLSRDQTSSTTRTSEEATMLEILLGSLKAFCNDATLIPRGRKPANYRAPESPSLQITREFLPVMDRMFVIYSADAVCLANVLSIVLLFDLTVYADASQQTACQTLLKNVGSVVLKFDQRLVARAVQVLNYFKTEPLLEASVNEYWGQLLGDIQQAVVNTENEAALVAPLSRISVMLQSGPLKEGKSLANPNNQLFWNILRERARIPQASPALRLQIIEVMQYLLMWGLAGCLQSQDSKITESVMQKNIENTEECGEQLKELLVEALKNGSSNQKALEIFAQCSMAFDAKQVELTDSSVYVLKFSSVDDFLLRDTIAAVLDEYFESYVLTSEKGNLPLARHRLLSTMGIFTRYLLQASLPSSFENLVAVVFKYYGRYDSTTYDQLCTKLVDHMKEQVLSKSWVSTISDSIQQSFEVGLLCKDTKPTFELARLLKNNLATDIVMTDLARIHQQSVLYAMHRSITYGKMKNAACARLCLDFIKLVQETFPIQPNPALEEMQELVRARIEEYKGEKESAVLMKKYWRSKANPLKEYLHRIFKDARLDEMWDDMMVTAEDEEEEEAIQPMVEVVITRTPNTASNTPNNTENKNKGKSKKKAE